jgi:hypothetical protein
MTQKAIWLQAEIIANDSEESYYSMSLMSENILRNEGNEENREK